jgi:ribulose-phosphate 3-epimerase
MNTLVAPSILSANFGNLKEEISALEAADLIHLDLMDGHYVPNLSFGYPVIQKIRELTDKQLDAHLMVTNPQDYIDPLAKIGVSWISFHHETVYHPHRLIQYIKTKGVKAGLALNPGTPVNTLDSLYQELDFVLVMSVNPGYSGQQFIEEAIDKVSMLNEQRVLKGYKFLIEVDGGINNTNAGKLRMAGADILVSASYIFQSSDYSKAINSLKG